MFLPSLFYNRKKTIQSRNPNETTWSGLHDISFIEFFRDVSKFAMHFIVEEIDADTSMEELQKMMLVALVYRILVCFYEVSFLQDSAPSCVFWLSCLFSYYNFIPISAFRPFAFGEQEEPLQGSFSLDSELSHATLRSWFNPTGCL